MAGNFAEGLSPQIALGLAEEIEAMTRRQIKLGGKNLKKIVEAFKENLINPADREALNEGIALEMRLAVVEAYKTNVVAVRSAPPYRRGDRLSGTLLKTLESDRFIRGTSQDIEYDFTTLNAVARHWGRLNFGASPGHGFNELDFPRISVRIQFGKNQGFSLQLPGEMSPSFRVPEEGAYSGYFEPNGTFFIGYPKKKNAHTGRFRPKGERGGLFVVKGKVSKNGIAPRHFMDAGLLAFKAKFKIRYLQFMQDAARKAEAREG